MKIRIVFAVMLLLIGCILLQQCKRPAAQNNLPVSQNRYTGDKACRDCHAKESNDWLKSDHFMAMQPATDSFVKGDFHDAHFSADGVSNRFFKKDGKYLINTQGPDGANHDYEVKYIFGYYPLQQYLIEFPGGRMQATRASWDAKNHKWFHQYAGQKIPAHDWLHWTGNAQNWNTMCASCHSTDLQKNYDIGSDSYHTTFNSINVSCESCHGPGALHIDYINSAAYKNGDKKNGSYLKLSAKSSQLSEINTCAPCHARKSDISANLLDGDELLDDYIPEIPDTEHFYADGQMNDEDYNYTSFLQSKMFHRGVKCSNCHNPHTGKRVFEGNLTCMQCHAKTYDEPGHTFHAAGTEASTCVSCHMPGKLYMGNDYRHDHSFRVPRPDLSLQYNTPNACNNCHKDRSFEWAATAVKKWYGPNRKYHFAEDLIPGSLLNASSEPHLVKLIADTAVPNIVKAAALKYLSDIPGRTGLQSILSSLHSNDAHIRYRALKALSSFPSSNWTSAVAPMVQDKVRAVRIAAAELLTEIPVEQIPAEWQQAFMSAKNEFESYLFYQADFSVGNVMIADYSLQKKDYFNAEKFYLRALGKDGLMNYARLNLATVYSAKSENQKALSVLQEALKTDPANDRVYYSLGLLYNELKDTVAALRSFEKAMKLESLNPKLYYNYALMLMNNNQPQKAMSVLQAGIGINSQSPELYYALAFLQLRMNDRQGASASARRLKQLDPSNPQYQELFAQFGI